MKPASTPRPDDCYRLFTNLILFAVVLLLNGAHSPAAAESASSSDEVDFDPTVETVRVKTSTILNQSRLNQSRQTLSTSTSLPMSPKWLHSTEEMSLQSFTGSAPVDGSNFSATSHLPLGVLQPSGYEIHLAAMQPPALGDAVVSVDSTIATIACSNLESTPFSLSEVELLEEGNLPLALILEGFSDMDGPTERAGLPEGSWASPAFIR